ncbi:tetratricopeptide repeat (TPR)-like superfamily protein [Actinidia rufa]|uniref:Tetratricopeptide repeat (TPR)-like superfamily protein n=1 Tax=Actinidia rufa TaxID=165716 RepID=A0A7J0DLZ6_9ERIC|nr:tetratricopeptide repeat (TPR)-like superfamily protein [Actinidia rufa]
MYAKFGQIEAAKYVFDKMPDRNGATWNTMLSAYVRVGSYPDAVSFFREMGDRQIEPSGYMIASLVTACSRSGNMAYGGFQIHGFVIKLGLLWDVYVGTALLHFYGVYGFASSAKRLFVEMPERNVVSWTSLMVAYQDNGDIGEVLDIYQHMRREGVGCNQNSFTTVISSCGLLENELLGYQVLAHVIKSGHETNVSVANSLISMFGSFCSIQDACYVFTNMIERDTISWNSMVTAYVHNELWEESLRCFCFMRRFHSELDSTTLSSLLSVFGTLDNLKWGTGIHGLVVKLGFDLDVCVCNTLLTMYSEAGKLIDAEEVFQGMPERDVISWNSVMAAYILDGKCLEGLRVLNCLLKKRKSMNYVTFASALAACSSSEFIAEGKIIHALVIMAGLHDNFIVGNALVTMYGKCRMLCEAKQVFQKMSKKDLVTWNALIGGYAENEEPGEAMKFFKLMRGGGPPANYITVVNVLGACLAPNALLIHGMPMHAYIILTGFESDDYVNNSLITMYAKCGDLNSSSYIFSRFLSKNPVTWNAMVAAHARCGDGEEALKLFVEMQRAVVHLDQFSLSAALAASANLAILEEGQQLHGLGTKLGFDSYLSVTNATMDMYGKCGEMDDVQKLLPESNMRSRLSWNILISAFARHENVRGQMDSHRIKKQPACSWVN